MSTGSPSLADNTDGWAARGFRSFGVVEMLAFLGEVDEEMCASGAGPVHLVAVGGARRTRRGCRRLCPPDPRARDPSRVRPPRPRGGRFPAHAAAQSRPLVAGGLETSTTRPCVAQRPCSGPPCGAATDAQRGPPEASLRASVDSAGRGPAATGGAGTRRPRPASRAQPVTSTEAERWIWADAGAGGPNAGRVDGGECRAGVAEVRQTRQVQGLVGSRGPL